MSYRESAMEKDPAWTARGIFIVSRSGRHTFRADTITSAHYNDAVGVKICYKSGAESGWQQFSDKENWIEDLLSALIEARAFELEAINGASHERGTDVGTCQTGKKESRGDQ